MINFSEFKGDYFKHKIRGIKSNNSKRGNIHNFSVDTEYIKSIFPQNHKCPVTGINFDLKDKMNCPSLDRIDNNLGYVKGNLVWVSRKVNLIKNIADAKTILKIVNFYKNLLNEKN